NAAETGGTRRLSCTGVSIGAPRMPTLSAALTSRVGFYPRDPHKTGHTHDPGVDHPRLLVRYAERDLVFSDRRAFSGSVTGRHRVQRLVAPLEIIISLEEENYERLLGYRIVKNDDLLGWHVFRPLVALHLALHLRHAVAADAFKGHDSCERHTCLLVQSSTQSKPSATDALPAELTSRLPRCRRAG